jgi:Na+-driven multidrug efflux pump
MTSGAVLNLALCYLFVTYLDMKDQGAAISMSLSSLYVLIVMAV